MTENASEGGSSLKIGAQREQVFDHRLDPTTYPDWLVGAKQIRVRNCGRNQACLERLRGRIEAGRP